MGSGRTRFGAMVAVMAAALVMAGPAAAQSAAVGSWEGALVIPGAGSLTLLYHIEAAADGALTGTLDSPDQGATGIPLSAVTFTNGVLTAVSEAVPGEPTFIATLSEDGTTLSGTFTQGQGSLPLELTKQ